MHTNLNTGFKIHNEDIYILANTHYEFEYAYESEYGFKIHNEDRYTNSNLNMNVDS